MINHVKRRGDRLAGVTSRKWSIIIDPAHGMA